MQTNRRSVIAIGVAVLLGCSESHRPAEGYDGGGGPVLVPEREAGTVSPFDASVDLDGGPPLRDGGRDGGPLPLLPAAVSGEGELLNLFVTEEGWILVLRDHVRLVARDGSELARWQAPREITTAAFDGSYVGVADRAALTALVVPTLDEVSSVLLIDECEAAVIVSGHRFVCGPENDWDRVFYTYDLEAGEELARSAEYTYNGIPMRQMPGRDAFVTVTVSLSPSDFHLYRVGETGTVEFVNESPYHGDFAVTNVYAFHGMPATHVVTHQGLLLRADQCESGFPAESTCFYRDGMLGTLASGSVFLGMDSGADGQLYALAGRHAVFSDDMACAGDCEIQRIDVAERRVSARTSYAAPFRGLVSLRHDARANGVVIATHSTCEWGERCSDWSVRAVELE